MLATTTTTSGRRRRKPPRLGGPGGARGGCWHECCGEQFGGSPNAETEKWRRTISSTSSRCRRHLSQKCLQLNSFAKCVPATLFELAKLAQLGLIPVASQARFASQICGFLFSLAKRPPATISKFEDSRQQVEALFDMSLLFYLLPVLPAAPSKTATLTSTSRRPTNTDKPAIGFGGEQAKVCRLVSSETANEEEEPFGGFRLKTRLAAAAAARH